ncbi:APC family permease [Amycolatopsis cihanbeyliensis]|uniref:Amino acid efflux transporter n=1 Tax=Amycolatopsis cihanbeyliensis TaxID=1128664 RepID=A0A542CSZ0_AMYCI|nr:amino acid permease [Amycolatopsis cihanbeyliensis]TQI93900.1 amino acid efflux transporter [Amycolatopsis cihanbeyliensis]
MRSGESSSQLVAAEAPAELTRHLGLGPAVALAITTVIGGGVLALPGAALREAGNSAFLGWLLAVLITVPLLAVFARLGATYPSAGGVAGFVRATFGRVGAAGVEVVLIGTFGLGMPAIALSGGAYLAAVFGWPASSAWIGAIALLLLGAGVLLGGGVLSSRVQAVLATVLTLALAAVGVVGLSSPVAEFTAPDLGVEGWSAAFAVVGIVFFGFTGWEIVAFTVGEYRDPRRDFPRVVGLSFVIVVGVYLLLAAGVQAVLDPASPRTETAPIAELFRVAISPTAASLVSVLGVLILAANLVGAMWGASRLIFSSAGTGVLPRPLSVLSGGGATPRRAVVAATALFLLVVGVSAAGFLSPRTMFRVAGQNFFLLYILSAVVFARVAATRTARTFGRLLACCLGVVVVVGFDPVTTAYAVALFALGCGVALRRGWWTGRVRGFRILGSPRPPST